jgi:hypothetical protein
MIYRINIIHIQNLSCSMIKKFISAFVLVILLAYTAYLFSTIVPWWGFSIGAFIAGVAVPQKAWLSWLSGFAGLFVCWAVLVWYTSNQNNDLMAIKMAEVLPLNGSSGMLIIITALIGAVVGGFACLTGAYLRKQ